MARVLVVEDEAPVLMLAESLLEQAGHEVVAAHTLAEANSVIQSGDHVDLVFTDLELGNNALGGYTVAELVKTTRPGTPVLYTSGHSTRCAPLLPKPYTGKQLTDAVMHLLRSRTPDA